MTSYQPITILKNPPVSVYSVLRTKGMCAWVCDRGGERGINRQSDPRDWLAQSRQLSAAKSLQHHFNPLF